MCLLEEGEELDGLLALQPEAILLRWFNYHLERVRALSMDRRQSSRVRLAVVVFACDSARLCAFVLC